MRYIIPLKNKFIVFSITSSFILAGSCQKNEEDAQIQSLDNFAGTSAFQLNKCSAVNIKTSYQQAISVDLPKDLSSAEKEAMKSEFYKSLSVIPDELVQVAKSLKAQVTLKPDAEAQKICSAASDATQSQKRSLSESSKDNAHQGENRFPSCFFRKSEGEPLLIVMSSAKITGKDGKMQYKFQHSIVRVFSYLTTSHMDSMKSTLGSSVSDFSESNSDLKDHLAEFSDIRSELTDVYFRADLAAYPGVTLIKEKYDGKSVNKKLQFENDVLAEVFDSCYCSDTTRSTFAKKFPHTFRYATKTICPSMKGNS